VGTINDGKTWSSQNPRSLNVRKWLKDGNKSGEKEKKRFQRTPIHEYVYFGAWMTAGGKKRGRSDHRSGGVGTKTNRKKNRKTKPGGVE